jgi:hypothetical protein
MRASLPPMARYRPVGASETAMQEEVCALRVWEMSKEG